MPVELTPEQITLIVVGSVLVFGIWLAGLSYLMWRAFHQKAKASPAAAPPEEKAGP